jgi:hypothetical protein
MKNGNIGELGGYGIRRGNSISDWMVYFRSSGCGNISAHCDGFVGDYQIQIDIVPAFLCRDTFSF